MKRDKDSPKRRREITRRRFVELCAVDRGGHWHFLWRLKPLAETVEMRRCSELDLQSVCPAGSQLVETWTADNMSAGRTGHRPNIRGVQTKGLRVCVPRYGG